MVDPGPGGPSCGNTLQPGDAAWGRVRSNDAPWLPGLSSLWPASLLQGLDVLC